MFSIEGKIVNKDGAERGRIEIDQDTGLILNVGPDTGIADVVLQDEIIFPGFIDLHVHAREDASHTQEYKEDYTTASEAAINGGVVAYLDMPNNIVPPIDDESYEKKNVLTKKSPVEVLLYAGIGPATSPLQKSVPYKVFMGKSVGELFFTNNEDLEHRIERYRGQSVSFHCEDPKILDSHAGEKSHEAKRPPEAEILAIDLALSLIEKYQLQGKICHASTVEGIQQVIEAKKRGVNVSVEVTPHHLFFDESMLTEKNHTSFQVNPPIRQSRENRLFLIEALKNGDIDYLATDHAPHSREEKEKGISGLTHLDTYGPFITWLIKEHSFTPQGIARICSTNPARFMNQFIENKYGKIEKDFVGSLTIIDMNKSVLISEGNLKTKSHWSPFLGATFPGSVAMTIIKGKKYV
ncbi:MAG: dihydroorotase [Candidatus Paceibacterota bacterium]|jgi:dihydroorotase